MNIGIDEMAPEFEHEAILDQLELPRNPETQGETRINDSGHKLLEICKTLNLFICKG